MIAAVAGKDEVGVWPEENKQVFAFDVKTIGGLEYQVNAFAAQNRLLVVVDHRAAFQVTLRRHP